MIAQKRHIVAHKHAVYHRDEILHSQSCGCFYCMSVFPPSEIRTWIDKQHGEGRTALCPHCGVDSVIGSKSGYEITDDLLRAMHEYWF